MGTDDSDFLGSSGKECGEGVLFEDPDDWTEDSSGVCVGNAVRRGASEVGSLFSRFDLS